MMRQLFKPILFLVATSFIFALCGCGIGSKQYLIKESWNQREPLPEDAEVIWLVANEVPVPPYEAEFIATMINNMDFQCTAEAAIDVINKTARELGANLVYAKIIDKVQYSYSNGTASYSKTCDYFKVDLYALPREAK